MKKSTYSQLVKLSRKYSGLGNRMSEKKIEQKIKNLVKGKGNGKQNKS